MLSCIRTCAGPGTLAFLPYHTVVLHRLRHIKAVLLELSSFMSEESAPSAELGAELDSNELLVPQHLEVSETVPLLARCVDCEGHA